METDNTAINKSESENNFDWDKTKRHIATLPNDTERIKHLITRIADFEQVHGRDKGNREWMQSGVWFDDQCSVEIQKLRALKELEAVPSTETKSKLQFKLSNRKGVKTDMIRILNAVYELHLVQNTDGTYPTKELFMKQAGEFFGIDLSKYEIDLSQAMNNVSIEANLKIFDDMKAITQKKVLADKKQ